MQQYSNNQTPVNKAAFDSSPSKPAIKCLLSNVVSEPNQTSPPLAALWADLCQHKIAVSWSYFDRDGEWAKVPATFTIANGRPRFYRKEFLVEGKQMPPADVAALVHYMQSAGHNTVGLGLVMNDDNPYSFIDIDDCRDPSTGVIIPAVVDIIKDFDSYTEVSNSGTGIKILVKGKKPGPRCKGKLNGIKVEIFSRKKFTATTFDFIPWSGSLIPEERTDKLAALYNATFPVGTRHLDDDQGDVAGGLAGSTDGSSHRHSRRGSAAAVPGSNLTDRDILDYAERAANGAKFRRLWAGSRDDYAGDKSAADLGLASILAFYCGNAPDRIIALMRQSGLARPKWERYADYLLPTVEKAIAGCSSFYGDGTWLGDVSSAELREMTEAALPAGFFENLFGGGAPAVGKALPSSSTDAPAADPPSSEVPSPAEPTAGDVDRDLDAGTDEPHPATSDDGGLLDGIDLAARLAMDDRPAAGECSYFKPLINPTNGEARIVQLRCKCWSCLTCSKLLKEEYKIHLRGVLLNQVIAPGKLGAVRTESLHFAEIDNDATTWNRIRKQIELRHGLQVNVQNSDRLTIVSTVPFEGSAAMTPEAAVIAICKAIDDISIYGDTKRPIHKSRRWSLPPKKKGDLKTVGSYERETSKRDVIDDLERQDIQYKAASSRSAAASVRWKVVFSIPYDMDRVAAEGYLPQAKEWFANQKRRIDGVGPDDFEIVMPLTPKSIEERASQILAEILLI